MPTAEYHRKRRAGFKASGHCYQCGRSLPDGDSHIRCSECRAPHLASAKRTRDRRRREHRCTDCGKALPPTATKHGCAECRAENAAKAKRYVKKNPKKHQAAQRRVREKLKMDVFNAYGGPICACCGETHIEFLTIDHINNDGARHRRKIGVERGSIMWWLRKNNYPPGFQVLCLNCNYSRGFFGYCPHEKERQSSAPPVVR